MKLLDNYYRDKFKEVFKREYQNVYVLDLYSLVDGRVVNFFKHTGFNGRIVVPDFVKRTLEAMDKSRQFVESSKGRRGLVALKKLTEQLFEEGRSISSVSFEDEEMISRSGFDQEIHRSAMRYHLLCESLIGVPIVVTAHAEFTKLIRAHNICVVNVNELADDLQDMIFVGEKYSVKLTGLGSEEGQTTGYVNSKTLCVVSNSSKYMGQTVPVVVKNIIQRPSGRIIFASLQWEG